MPSITIDQLVDFMKAADEPPKYYIPNDVNNRYPAMQASIQTPINLAGCYYLANYNGYGSNFGDLVDAIPMWVWVYMGQGHTASGKRIQIRNPRLYLRLDAKGAGGSWYACPYFDSVRGVSWAKNQGDGPDPDSFRLESSGGASILMTPSGGWEAWADNSATPSLEFYSIHNRAIFERTVSAAGCAEVRMINDNGTPYRGTDGRICAAMGYDLYSRNGGVYPFVSGAKPGGLGEDGADGGKGRWKTLKAEEGDADGWHYVAFATVDFCYKKDGPRPPWGNYDGSWDITSSVYNMTESELRLYPPPFVSGAGTPPPPPPPTPTGGTRYNYMLNSESWNGSNFNMVITDEPNPPSGLTAWSRITGGATHTGGATKFCDIPNGNFVASIHAKAGNVNFMLVKVQPNTYNKASFNWINLVTGEVTTTNVNMPSAVTTEAVATDEGWRIAIKTALSEGVPVGVEVSPVTGVSVFQSTQSSYIIAGGLQFEPGTEMTNYKASGSVVEVRSPESITLDAFSDSVGVGSSVIVTATIVDNEGTPWDKETLESFVSDDTIASFGEIIGTNAFGQSSVLLTGLAAGSVTFNMFFGTGDPLESNTLSLDVLEIAQSSLSVTQQLENFSQIVTAENIDEDPEPLPAIELGVTQQIFDFTQSIILTRITSTEIPETPTLIVGQSGVSPVVMVGTGIAGAIIKVYIDGIAQADSITVDSDGVWSTSLDMDEGTYSVAVSQRPFDVESNLTDAQQVTILATGQGSNRFRSGSGTGPRKAIRPTKPTKSSSWPTR